MNRYMIERQYGHSNSDWLHELSLDTTTWSGAPIALVFSSLRDARRSLAAVRRQARAWSTGHAFSFHIIHDRSELPSEIASAPVTPRTRSGSWTDFERQFQPIIRDDGSLIWHAEELPCLVNSRHWWTVLDCDGRLYVSAGFRFVNRIGYLRTEIPWTEDDLARDWRYD